MSAEIARRKEIGLIKLAQKNLAIEDSSYRAMLKRVTGKESAAELDASERSAVIAELRRLGFTYDPGKRRTASEAVAPLAGKIRALWHSLWALGEIPDVADEALAGFIRATAKVDAERFLTVKAANKVIEGLKARCERAGFVQPDAKYIADVESWRKHAGRPPGGAGFAARVRLIEAQWKRLIALGAMETGVHARLDTWLMGRFRDAQGHAIREPYWLSRADTDRAIGQLGEWIRRVNRYATPQR